MSVTGGDPFGCGVHLGKVLITGGADASRRYLTPAEARALAAELEEAAWQVEQNANKQEQKP